MKTDLVSLCLKLLIRVNYPWDSVKNSERTQLLAWNKAGVRASKLSIVGADTTLYWASSTRKLLSGEA